MYVIDRNVINGCSKILALTKKWMAENREIYMLFNIFISVVLHSWHTVSKVSFLFLNKYKNFPLLS